MLPHWTEGSVTVDGLEFHYTRTGDGSKPSLVLLHGFSDNGLCWLPVARDLEADYDVVMPDAKGHGLSARIQPGQQLDHATDMAGLITALGLEKPVVGGHSMGGLTATEMGARYPNLISGLILEDPAWIDPSPDDVPLRQNPFFEWLTNLDKLSLAEVIAFGKTANPLWSDDEFPAWAASKQQLDKTIFEVVNIRKPWREFVSAFTVPALLVTADVTMNAIVSAATAQEAASLSPNLQIAHVPNAGHNIRRENYAAFMQAVWAFLG
ncbi:MAG: alpha/beta hydrolase [Ardenticatenaceae bacterium]|nr:alpha/beta hydrolase [Ardenticatenaceae bacterium]